MMGGGESEVRLSSEDCKRTPDVREKRKKSLNFEGECCGFGAREEGEITGGKHNAGMIGEKTLGRADHEGCPTPQFDPIGPRKKNLARAWERRCLSERNSLPRWEDLASQQGRRGLRGKPRKENIFPRGGVILPLNGDEAREKGAFPSGVRRRSREQLGGIRGSGSSFSKEPHRDLSKRGRVGKKRDIQR